MDCQLSAQMLREVMNDSARLEGVDPVDGQEIYARKFLEDLEIVDDSGNVLGAAPRGIVHRVGLRHSVVYCVFYDAIGDHLLLQTRGSGRLDVTVGGHVQFGELDYVDALMREVREEIGLMPDRERFTQVTVYNRDVDLRPKRPLERNRERRHLFRYVLSTSEQAQLSTLFDRRIEHKEVLGVEWFSPSEVRAAVEQGQCADGLAASAAYFLDRDGEKPD